MLCFFFNDPPPSEIYTLSLHDALPISARAAPAATDGGAGEAAHPRRDHAVRFPRGDGVHRRRHGDADGREKPRRDPDLLDRKSTRLNSSHTVISYAVFCLKKKKTQKYK